MRFLIGWLLALALSGCVSGKKARTNYTNYEMRIDSLDRRIFNQEDTIYNLTLALERSRGGNDMLLVTQDRLQDRLAAQDDELEQLRGNFSASSSEMNERITDLREQREAARARMDSLISAQRRAIANYSDGLRRAANTISDSLETKIPSDKFSVVERPGEIVFTVQEDVLFRPRSVESLTRDSEKVLRTLTDILQANPLLKLNIVGHTDNQPNPRRGTDNWEYAALRATRLAASLATDYYVSPNRLVAASQGEFSPARSNSTTEGRTSNRRIDFVFTSSIGNMLRELEKVAEIRD